VHAVDRGRDDDERAQVEQGVHEHRQADAAADHVEGGEEQTDDARREHAHPALVGVQRPEDEGGE